jgi:hypothetical protein
MKWLIVKCARCVAHRIDLICQDRVMDCCIFRGAQDKQLSKKETIGCKKTSSSSKTISVVLGSEKDEGCGGMMPTDLIVLGLCPSWCRLKLGPVCVRVFGAGGFFSF